MAWTEPLFHNNGSLPATIAANLKVTVEIVPRCVEADMYGSMGWLRRSCRQPLQPQRRGPPVPCVAWGCPDQSWCIPPLWDYRLGWADPQAGVHG